MCNVRSCVKVSVCVCVLMNMCVDVSVRVCVCVCVRARARKTEGDNGVACRILQKCGSILLYCVQIVVKSLTKWLKGDKD